VDLPPAELPGFDVPPKKHRAKPKRFERRDLIMCSTLPQSEKGVLHVILAHYPKAEPGEERIRLMASVCLRTARNAIRGLEARGVLLVSRRRDATSRYRINFDRLVALRDPRLR
jgi:hypothetical protein